MLGTKEEHYHRWIYGKSHEKVFVFQSCLYVYWSLTPQEAAGHAAADRKLGINSLFALLPTRSLYFLIKFPPSQPTSLSKLLSYPVLLTERSESTTQGCPRVSLTLFHYSLCCLLVLCQNMALFYEPWFDAKSLCFEQNCQSDLGLPQAFHKAP